ncbi:MAG: hypothetical protein RBR08_16185 [Desulforegulaceae bacterium]|nr:hypothetical protein [Desulforegulaceae bacterium]
MFSKKKLYVVLGLALFSFGCNGGGSSSSPVEPKPTSPSEKKIISSFDSVSYEGFLYRTSLMEAGKFEITEKGSKISYFPGEKVQFYLTEDYPVGNEVQAATLKSISGLASDPKSNDFKNVLALLLTLDLDNDPSNGIQINSAILAEMKGLAFDFSMEPSQFFNQVSVKNLLDRMNANPAIVAEKGPCYPCPPKKFQDFLENQYKESTDNSGQTPHDNKSLFSLFYGKNYKLSQVVFYDDEGVPTKYGLSFFYETNSAITAYHGLPTLMQSERASGSVYALDYTVIDGTPHISNINKYNLIDDGFGGKELDFNNAEKLFQLSYSSVGGKNYASMAFHDSVRDDYKINNNIGSIEYEIEKGDGYITTRKKSSAAPMLLMPYETVFFNDNGTVKEVREFSSGSEKVLDYHECSLDSKSNSSGMCHNQFRWDSAGNLLSSENAQKRMFWSWEYSNNDIQYPPYFFEIIGFFIDFERFETSKNFHRNNPSVW